MVIAGKKEALGVLRISICGGLARAVYFQMRQAARKMMGGSFRFTDKKIPQAELNRLLGSDQYGTTAMRSPWSPERCTSGADEYGREY